MTATNRNNENQCVRALNNMVGQQEHSVGGDVSAGKGILKRSFGEDKLTVSPHICKPLISTSKQRRPRPQRPCRARALVEGSGISTHKHTIINSEGFPIAKASVTSGTRRPSSGSVVKSSTPIARGGKNHLQMDETAAYQTDWRIRTTQ